MSVSNVTLTHNPTAVEPAATNQSLREELELAKKHIAALREESEYYRKMALAMSRKAISADTLVEWLKDEPEAENFSFKEVMAELEKNTNH